MGKLGNEGGGNSIPGKEKKPQQDIDSPSSLMNSKKFILVASLSFLTAVGITLGLSFASRDNSIAEEAQALDNHNGDGGMNPCINRTCPVDRCFCNTQEWEFDTYSSFTTEIYRRAEEAIANNSNYLVDFVVAVGDIPTGNTIKDELEYLLQLQTNRTEKDEQLIRGELYCRDMVPRILGQFETPELREIAEQAGRAYSMSVPLFLLKSHFDRVRPSFLDSNIKPSISVPSHPAYPSGHSTQATTMALAVSCVDPMNRDFYLSNLVGWRRELAGVHYPSDTAAGKKLASFVFADVAMEIGLANATLCNATIF